MTDIQAVPIVDEDQLQDITAQIRSPSTSTLQIVPEVEQKKWEVKLPRLQHNHVTAMMIVCLAVSCFITVFSLLMIIIPFITEVSKYQRITREKLDWSDRSLYETMDQMNEKTRFKRSPPDNTNKWRRDVGSFPPTGPEALSPGEAIQTSQQLTVNLPRVLQQICVLKPTQNQFPPESPSYICYPDKANKKRDQQSVHIPTAISSPNPYYFPTVAGSPVINPSFQSKPVSYPYFNPQPPPPPHSPYYQSNYHYPHPHGSPYQQPFPVNPLPQTPPAPVYNPVPHLYQPINIVPQPQFQLQCTFHPAPGTPYQVFSFPPVVGVMETQRKSGIVPNSSKTAVKHQPKFKFSEGECLSGDVSCGDMKGTCISSSSVCNSLSDCPNAEDETSCSCMQRLPSFKHCDGITDCPSYEDEKHCHGCGPGYFSCEDVSNPRVTCLPLVAKCDGVVQCPNRKDEEDCVLLSDKLRNQMKPFVSYNEGYIHQNWRGIWYPVCMKESSVNLAQKACTAEQGFHYYGTPTISHPLKPDFYRGPFLSHDKESVSLTSDCYGDRAVYVNCPPVQCGRQKRHEEHVQYYRRYRQAHPQLTTFLNDIGNSQEQNTTINRLTREQEGRVVGGWKSEPGKWPWLVAIYKNGTFHCGGVIISRLHILTAAHCFLGYQNDYFEVHAGIIRRLSFSPQRQIRKISEVFIHHSYKARTMQNDVCVIKLNKELNLNRWVSIVCLPPKGARFPNAGDTCTAVGWGATHEHGPDPDHMHEVDVPILSACKYRADRKADEICAGAIEGGKDSCQGDSGGPLMCRSSSRWGSTWIVSGIVSHGEGCARPNEPGAYTRVSLYVDWIEQILNDRITGRKMSQECPGRKCNDGRCIVPKNVCDGYVDCLNAEDEVDCLQTRGSPFESIQVLNNFYLPRDSEKNTSSAPSSKSSHIPMITPKKEITIKNLERNDEKRVQTLNSDESDDSQSEDNHDKTLRADPISNRTSLSNSSYIFDFSPDVNGTYTCLSYNQIVRSDHRCDGYMDCLDGSDEHNCPCSDSLRYLNPELLCDSNIDCYDLSDEKNCSGHCANGEVYLPGNRICIPVEKRCNFVADFPDAEDEDGCYSLVSNVSNIEIYKENILVPSLRGLLMGIKPGITYPIPICCPFTQFNRTSDAVIEFLGFGGWEWSIPVKFPKIHPANCTGVYGVAKEHPKFGRKAPWLISIVIKGRPSATGVLIDTSWVLTPDSNINENYQRLEEIDLFVRVGFLSVSRGLGPRALYEDMARVDKAIVIPDAGVTLLRLESPVNVSPTVKPLSLLENVSISVLDRCYAVGLIMDVTLHVMNATRVQCNGSNVCYTVSSSQLLHSSGGGKDGAARAEEYWSGGVWCEDEGRRPYLDCVFTSMSLCFGPCSFKCLPVLNHYSLLTNITDQYKSSARHNEILNRSKRIPDIDLTKSSRMNWFGNDYRLFDWNNINYGDYFSDYDIVNDYDDPLFIDPPLVYRQSGDGTEKQNKIKRKTDNESFTDTNYDLEPSELIKASYDLYRNINRAISMNRNKPNKEKNQSSISQVISNERSSVAPSKEMTNPLKLDESGSLKVINVGKKSNCSGFTCPQGSCIEWSRDNGFPDCMNGVDVRSQINQTENWEENPHSRLVCGADQMSCGDGKCVALNKFCNGEADCATGVDEPQSCATNCSSFLSVRHPHLLCDGQPHCYDLTDESWQTCGQRAACNQTSSYACQGSDGCVHGYQVCDGVKDCPLGDDEKICNAIESNPDRTWEGFVVSRILGQWLPQCFKRPLPQDFLNYICQSFGHHRVANTDYINSTVTLPLLEPYFTLALNSKVTYSLIVDRPVFLNKRIDSCLQLYITCS